MRPMSLYETGDSNGAVSLSALLDGEVCSARRPSPAARPETELREVVEVMCRGGWPACENMHPAEAQDFIAAYLDEVCRVDALRVNGVRHDPVGIQRTVQSLARHTAASPTMRTLAADVGAGSPVSHETLRSYLDALTRIFVIEDQNSWAPHLTSRARLRKAAKRHLTDPRAGGVCSERPPPNGCSTTVRHWGISSNRSSCAIYASTPKRTALRCCTTATATTWKQTPSCKAATAHG